MKNSGNSRGIPREIATKRRDISMNNLMGKVGKEMQLEQSGDDY